MTSIYNISGDTIYNSDFSIPAVMLEIKNGEYAVND